MPPKASKPLKLPKPRIREDGEPWSFTAGVYLKNANEIRQVMDLLYSGFRPQRLPSDIDARNPRCLPRSQRREVKRMLEECIDNELLSNITYWFASHYCADSDHENLLKIVDNFLWYASFYVRNPKLYPAEYEEEKDEWFDFIEEETKKGRVTRWYGNNIKVHVSEFDESEETEEETESEPYRIVQMTNAQIAGQFSKTRRTRSGKVYTGRQPPPPKKRGSGPSTKTVNIEDVGELDTQIITSDNGTLKIKKPASKKPAQKRRSSGPSAENVVVKSKDVDESDTQMATSDNQILEKKKPTSKKPETDEPERKESIPAPRAIKKPTSRRMSALKSVKQKPLVKAQAAASYETNDRESEDDMRLLNLTLLKELREKINAGAEQLTQAELKWLVEYDSEELPVDLWKYQKALRQKKARAIVGEDIIMIKEEDRDDASSLTSIGDSDSDFEELSPKKWGRRKSNRPGLRSQAQSSPIESPQPVRQKRVSSNVLEPTPTVTTRRRTRPLVEIPLRPARRRSGRLAASSLLESVQAAVEFSLRPRKASNNYAPAQRRSSKNLSDNVRSDPPAKLVRRTSGRIKTNSTLERAQSVAVVQRKLSSKVVSDNGRPDPSELQSEFARRVSGRNTATGSFERAQSVTDSQRKKLLEAFSNDDSPDPSLAKVQPNAVQRTNSKRTASNPIKLAQPRTAVQLSSPELAMRKRKLEALFDDDSVPAAAEVPPLAVVQFSAAELATRKRKLEALFDNDDPPVAAAPSMSTFRIPKFSEKISEATANQQSNAPIVQQNLASIFQLDTASIVQPESAKSMAQHYEPMVPMSQLEIVERFGVPDVPRPNVAPPEDFYVDSLTGAMMEIEQNPTLPAGPIKYPHYANVMNPLGVWVPSYQQSPAPVVHDSTGQYQHGMLPRPRGQKRRHSPSI